jgi:hypothetical protein
MSVGGAAKSVDWPVTNVGQEKTIVKLDFVHHHGKLFYLDCKPLSACFLNFLSRLDLTDHRCDE